MKKIIVVMFILIISSLTILCGCDFTSGNSNVTETNLSTSISNVDSSSTVTIGERNALRSAKNYLRTMAFSKSGLISQLEFEGYSLEEATYAVNNCGADWNEQAYKKAKEYLRAMAFSKESLIEQLEFEGFTHEQAVYGVEQAYK